MQIKYRPMGPYQTNCYILIENNSSIIIDPGIDATDWVLENAINPLAILNTHGHFDHVWSNKELKERLGVPIFCPKGDTFMLESDPFGQGVPISKADVEVEPNEKFKIRDFEVTFLHFPGHTPGCSSIEIADNWFCGDFLFKESIGRVDFPYSDPGKMKDSLKRALEYPKNVTLFPGHGPRSTLEAEKRGISYWIELL